MRIPTDTGLRSFRKEDKKEKRPGRSRTGKLALAAMMAASGTALLLLSGTIPVLTYAAPLLAALFLVPSEIGAGKKAAAAVWAVTAGLALLLGADKEAAVFYLLFGWYPVWKSCFDRIKTPALRMAAKAGLFLTAGALLLAVTVLLLGIGESVAEIPGLHWADGLFLLGMTAVMMLFDRALDRLRPMLQSRIKKLL